MTDSEWLSIVNATVLRLLQKSELLSPPVDAIAIARQIPLQLVWDNSQTSRGRLQRLAGQTTILLRHDERPERVQWAAAHEIGESVIWQMAQEAGVSAEDITPRARESLANLFASRLLLPEIWWIQAEPLHMGDVPALKTVFATASHELIAMRLLDKHCPRVISIWDQGQLTRRRSNIPGKTLPLAQLELSSWQIAHESNQAVDQQGLVGRVRCWPLHESEWKREISYWEPDLHFLENSSLV